MTAKQPKAIVPASMQSFGPTYGFAPGRISNGLLYIAGQIGADQNGLAETSEAQASLAFRNMELILKEAGCSFADVISITTYHVGDCTSVNEWFLPLKKDIFPAPYPIWTSMGVTSLAIPGAVIEIAAIAEIPGR